MIALRRLKCRLTICVTQGLPRLKRRVGRKALGGCRSP